MIEARALAPFDMEAPTHSRRVATTSNTVGSLSRRSKPAIQPSAYGVTMVVI